MAQEFSKKIYNSKKWQGVRLLALQRDNYSCKQCGELAAEVHHIVHLSPKNIHDPDIVFGLDNLMCVCKDCHNQIHERGKYKKQEAAEAIILFDSDGNPIPPI